MTQKFSQVRALLGLFITQSSLWGGLWAMHNWATTWAGFAIAFTALTIFTVGLFILGAEVTKVDTLDTLEK